ncbi:Six-hairpin glycosidase-like protein, partial [Pilaira anomala]
FYRYSKLFHSPKSDGLLGLPFQRPAEACRKFTSNIIESVIRNITSKITDLDLAQLFTNTYPNTLDTTIKSTSCLTTSDMTCLPLSYIITGDINAMWIRDSANQILPYINYIKQDINLKQLFLGTIYMQAHFFHIDPYANAFKEPNDIHLLSQSIYTTSSPLTKRSSSAPLQQDPTFNITSGEPLDTNYMFIQNTDRPTETQFLNGHGQPVKYTGMVKSLFRPSDDATVFPFFIPGNAMLSVELDHLSQLISSTNDTTTTTTTTTSSSRRLHQLATESSRLSKEIHDAIYKYGLIDHPTYGKIFAYEVDGYGSSLIMDDANIPSLLSLSFIGFINQNDTLYQNTRKLVLSKNNPYYFSGPRGSGIGGPHVNR